MRRRIKVLVIAVCVLVMMLGTTSMAYTNVIGKAGKGGANIRAKASTKSEIVASIGAYQEITLCGEVQGDDGKMWYFVYVDKNKTGYIRSDIITNTGVAAGGTTSDGAGSGGAGSGGETTKPGDGQGDGSTPATTYKLSIVRVGTGTLEPEFSPDVFEYTLKVDESVEKISVYALLQNENKSSIPDDVNFRNLVPGANDRYIEVTGTDGSKTTYHFNVIRGEIIDTPDEPVTPPADTETPEDTDNKDDAKDEEQKNPSATKDTNKKKVYLGGYKWLMIFMVLVIIALVMLVVYMALQMRDMRERIITLERERRRRKKKAAAHKISENDETKSGDDAQSSKPPMVSIYDVPGVKPFDKPELDLTKSEKFGPKKDNVTAPVETVETMETMETVHSIEIDDELEDIKERESVLLENQNALGTTDNGGAEKADWKPVNFLSPEDDSEIEFLDLDEDEK